MLHKGVLANYMDDFVIPAKNNEGIRRINSLIFEDSRKTQFVFQTVKIWFQHGRNSNSKSSCQIRTSSNGKRTKSRL